MKIKRLVIIITMQQERLNRIVDYIGDVQERLVQDAGQLFQNMDSVYKRLDDMDEKITNMTNQFQQFVDEWRYCRSIDRCQAHGITVKSNETKDTGIWSKYFLHSDLPTKEEKTSVLINWISAKTHNTTLYKRIISDAPIIFQNNEEAEIHIDETDYFVIYL